MIKPENKEEILKNYKKQRITTNIEKLIEKF